MLKTNDDKNVLSDSEKVEFLNHLEDKGETVGEGWRLIHSQICETNESTLDFNNLINSINIKSEKFAVDVVSNPNEKSFLDSGVIKVRYRYVLDPSHSGEQAIKDNTREFCETLIKKDLIYRREDINMMSFRGSNPISKKRYSIFNLQGHWNCRHAWQREIYVVPQRTKKVENGLLTSSKIAMSKENKTIKVQFGELLSKIGRKLTKEEIVELNSVMLSDEATNQKFVDIEVDGKILRIDADKPEEGAAVSWVDAEGNLTDVENGEIVVTIDEKEMILVVEDRVIKSVKDVESAEESPAAEEEMSTEETSSLKKEVADLKTILPTMIKDAIEARMTESAKTQTEKFAAIIDEKLKEIPAFNGEEISTNLSKENTSKGGTMLERITIGSGK